jgi:hypothetical protein
MAALIAVKVNHARHPTNLIGIKDKETLWNSSFTT